jgi:hypothetical protein
MSHEIPTNKLPKYKLVETEMGSSKCLFCSEQISPGKQNLARHVGQHMEEISFAVVTKPYDNWKFYDDTSSAKSSAPSVVMESKLHLAATYGDFTTVLQLLEKGVDVNAKNFERRTALEMAVSGGHEAVVWLLLQKGAIPGRGHLKSGSLTSLISERRISVSDALFATSTTSKCN